MRCALFMSRFVLHCVKLYSFLENAAKQKVHLLEFNFSTIGVFARQQLLFLMALRPDFAFLAMQKAKRKRVCAKCHKRV